MTGRPATTAPAGDPLGSQAGEGPITWFVIPRRGAGAHALDALQEDAARCGQPCARTSCNLPFPTAFAPIGDLLRQLLPYLERDAPEVVGAYARELVAFLPELARRAEWSRRQSVAEVALGGTKRRLQKDSEVLFRMVRGFASLVIAGAHMLAERGHGAVTLLVDDIDAADRLTLSAIHHLGRRITSEPMTMVLTGCDPADSRRADPWLWAGRPELDDDLADRLTDAYGLHRSTVANVLRALHPRRVVLDVDAPDAPHARHRPPAADDISMRRVDDALALGDTAAAIDHGIRAVTEAFSFSHDYERILLICRELLRATSASAEHRDGPATVAVWQLLGLAHAYLEHYDDAVACFSEAYCRSTYREVRAQSCYYAGLVRSKRQRDLDLGATWFRRGLEQLGTLEGLEARLERGWLLNGLAFVSWMRGDRVAAHALIDEALANARPVADVQLQNLEVNVLNNLSVLHEAAADWPAALATWRELAYLAEMPGAAVAKSYHYREGWLLMAGGESSDAAAAYERAYAAARDAGDLFHMDLIARAAGFLAHQRGHQDEARSWFEENVRVLLDHRDGWNLAAAWASLGYVAAAAGDVSGASAAFSSGLSAALRAGRPDLVGRLTAAAAAVRGGGDTPAEADLEGVRLEHPRPKLTTPFRLADLSAESAFDAALHTGVERSAAGVSPTRDVGFVQAHRSPNPKEMP